MQQTEDTHRITWADKKILLLFQKKGRRFFSSKNRLKKSISAFFSRFDFFILLFSKSGFYCLYDRLKSFFFVFSITGELKYITALCTGTQDT